MDLLHGYLAWSDVRVCVDMKMANKAMNREQHPSPTVNDLMHMHPQCSHGILETGPTLRISPIIPGTWEQIHNHIWKSWEGTPDWILVPIWWDISEHHQWVNLWHSRSNEHQWWCHHVHKNPRWSWQSHTSGVPEVFRWISQSVSSISTHWNSSDLCFQTKESLLTQRRSKQSAMPVHQRLPVVSVVFQE